MRVSVKGYELAECPDEPNPPRDVWDEEEDDPPPEEEELLLPPQKPEP
jgi:hypothetical protein